MSDKIPRNFLKHLLSTSAAHQKQLKKPDAAALALGPDVGATILCFAYKKLKAPSGHWKAILSFLRSKLIGSRFQEEENTIVAIRKAMTGTKSITKLYTHNDKGELFG